MQHTFDTISKLQTRKRKQMMDNQIAKQLSNDHPLNLAKRAHFTRNNEEVLTEMLPYTMLGKNDRGEYLIELDKLYFIHCTFRFSHGYTYSVNGIGYISKTHNNEYELHLPVETRVKQHHSVWWISSKTHAEDYDMGTFRVDDNDTLYLRPSHDIHIFTNRYLKFLNKDELELPVSDEANEVVTDIINKARQKALAQILAPSKAKTNSIVQMKKDARIGVALKHGHSDFQDILLARAGINATIGSFLSASNRRKKTNMLKAARGGGRARKTSRKLRKKG